MGIPKWREWSRNHLNHAIAIILTFLGRRTPWNYFTHRLSRIFLKETSLIITWLFSSHGPKGLVSFKSLVTPAGQTSAQTAGFPSACLFFNMQSCRLRGEGLAAASWAHGVCSLLMQVTSARTMVC